MINELFLSFAGQWHICVWGDHFCTQYREEIKLIRMVWNLPGLLGEILLQTQCSSEPGRSSFHSLFSPNSASSADSLLPSMLLYPALHVLYHLQFLILKKGFPHTSYNSHNSLVTVCSWCVRKSGQYEDLGRFIFLQYDLLRDGGTC